MGWTLHVSPDLNVELVPNYVPEDHWNIAVAMSRGDEELKRHVDAALGALIADGTVARVLGRYHVPYYAPFPELARDAQGKRREIDPARGRGPRPRASDAENPNVQAGVCGPGEGPLGRRAGGRAGPEQPPLFNGPPRAGGLDHEIAGLLAEQLGVRLRVYWAISAHDSYPSKLSAKGLCDVILGVMPDDRFERRVLFSRPYYLAKYQLVVRSGEGPPATRSRWPWRKGSPCAG